MEPGGEVGWGEDPVPAGGGSTRRVWIAAAAGGVVLAVLVGAAVLVAGSGGGGKHTVAAVPSPRTVTVTATAPVPSPALSSAGSAPAAVPSPGPGNSPASTSPGPAGPVVVWQGTVTINGNNDGKTLDTTPPSGGGELHGDWLETILYAGSGTKVAVYYSTDEHPSAATCRDLVSAGGSGRTPNLRVGDVVCAVTSAGRVARLIATTATQTSTTPILSFDTTLWQMPEAGQ